MLLVFSRQHRLVHVWTCFVCCSSSTTVFRDIMKKVQLHKYSIVYCHTTSQNSICHIQIQYYACALVKWPILALVLRYSEHMGLSSGCTAAQQSHCSTIAKACTDYYTILSSPPITFLGYNPPRFLSRANLYHLLLDETLILSKLSKSLLNQLGMCEKSLLNEQNLSNTSIYCSQ